MDRSWGAYFLVLVMALSGASCSCGSNGGPAGPSVSHAIGPEGGLLELGSMMLSVPAGALKETVDLRVVELDEVAETAADRVQVSKLYRVTPESLVLEKPATLVLPFL